MPRGLTVHEHAEPWAAYVSDRGAWSLSRVLVAVDSADDRIAVQASLPRWIHNGWTQVLDTGLSRHDFVNSACLACLYIPDGTQPNDSQVVAQALKIPDREPDVAKMLYTGNPVSPVFLKFLAERWQIRVEELEVYSGQTLRALYRAVVCGAMTIPLGSNDSDTSADVPLAFQSAFAGILMAADLLATVLGRHVQRVPALTRVNVLRPETFRSIEAPKRTSGCICADTDYVASYRAKYPG